MLNDGPLRVVVADDSVLLREGIVRLLDESEDFEVVAQAGDADDLLRKVSAHQPDVAVVDIRMPPTNTDDGLRAALEIRASQPDTACSCSPSTWRRATRWSSSATRAGGVGYLLKDRVADVERVRGRREAGGRRRVGARPGGGVPAARPRAPRRPAGATSPPGSARCWS